MLHNCRPRQRYETIVPWNNRSIMGASDTRVIQPCQKNRAVLLIHLLKLLNRSSRQKKKVAEIVPLATMFERDFIRLSNLLKKPSSLNPK